MLPASFISATGGAVILAKRVCALCDVCEICLMYAILLEDASNRIGVFGGATAPERSDLVRRAHITPDRAKEWYEVEQQVFIQHRH